jgi:hypothetical protein
MDIEDLYPEIRRQVRGCPEDSMRDGLMRAARIFCRETWFLRRQQTFTSAQGISAYPVIPPPNEEVIAIKHAQIQDIAPGQSIYPLRFAYQTCVNPGIGRHRPYAITFTPYTAANLVPTPDGAYPVTLELITQPISDSMSIPNELGVAWQQAIGHGALEWLLRTSKDDAWYDPQMAAYNLKMFNDAIALARGQIAFDMTPNQRRWAGGAFAWGGR